MKIRPFSISASVLAAILTVSCSYLPADNGPAIQAHRGGAAVSPENTIEAMIDAVRHGIDVIELDLHVTRDSQVVVSHDACLRPLTTLTPDGDTVPVTGGDGYRIYAMDYDSLSRFDVGSLPDPRWPHRKNIKCSVPRLADLIDSVETFTRREGLHPVDYNIEIKSSPSKDGIYAPDYKTFADECMDVILSKELGYRVIVQSFDVRTLEYLRSKYPSLCLSYLVEDSTMSFEEQMDKLNFVPQYYSPESRMLNAETVAKAHEMGMQVLPWTVDDMQEALRMKAIGVDAVITNQPDSMSVWLKSGD